MIGSLLGTLIGTQASLGGFAVALLTLLAVLDLALARRGRAAWCFFPAVAALLLGAPLVALALGLAALVFTVPSVRRRLLTSPVFALIKARGFLPSISATERTAIEAGTVWVDGELFSGRPDFERLLAEDYPGLTDEERAFLDGPVEEVCRMTSDWEVHRHRDLPPEVWSFLQRERFFGMIVPREFGGLGFSPSANSAVIARLSTRSQALAISVMVPNSLGPAELLLHHGTDAQRAHYLPRLARGEDVPCFALTEPGAGSDAGSLSSSGVVFRGEDGELYLRLQWTKRYITLAAISTLVGLAFRLRDPEELLGRGKSLGITCALIPADTPGVELGRRHDPLGVPFYNCPTEGHDVVVPVDAIIGGVDGAGRGWPMLMESLAAGRGISLPASSAGGIQLVARVASAHAAVRRQFGLPIGKFEGIEEPLARIGSHAYLLEAARRYTCGGLDGGARPSVITAIAKYSFTELCRKAMNDGMDILAGNGISRGPRNLLAEGYTGTPIMITVEGANILTRTLMIFGQGAIRCHPFARAEIEAFEAGDLEAFDRAFWGHVAHVLRNGCRAGLLSITRGAAALVPVGGPSARHLRKLAWASASFAFFADVAMGALGGNLKRREKITGRFADIFSWLYLCTAAVRRFEAEGRPEDQRPFLDWSVEHGLARIQEAFDGIFANLHVPVVGILLRGPLALWSRMNRIAAEPSDALGGRVARAMLIPGPTRDALTPCVYMPTDVGEALGRLEHALTLAHAAAGPERKLKAAIKGGRLARGASPEAAVAASVLSSEEAETLTAAAVAREDATAVDSFTLAEYLETAVGPRLSGVGAASSDPG